MTLTMMNMRRRMKKGACVNDIDNDDDDKMGGMSTPINILQSPLGI